VDLIAGETYFGLLEDSQRFAAELAERLRERIYESVVIST
jgi:hypothetical protein